MEDTRLAARRYISAGWAVVPIPPGEKGPRISDYYNVDFTEQSFAANDNIGVKLGSKSGNLVDIDLDCPEAVHAAQTLLLVTHRIHGRPSKPRSHFWYTCADAKSEAFKDVGGDQTGNGDMLVEIRANNVQTVLPPSYHSKAQEYLGWDEEGAIAAVEAAGLRRSVAMVATAALLARHWPGNGPLTNQHVTAGLAAGLLAFLKLADIEIELIIRAAAEAAHDDNVEDRVKFAQDTVKKFNAGARVSGGPKLADEVGEHVVKRIKSWFGTATGAIEELNEKHAVIFQQSGDLVVITEDMDVDGRPFIRYSSAEVIRQLYPRKIQIGTTARGPVFAPLGKAWLESPNRRFYNGIELAPNGKANPAYYNLWRGFAVEPKKGSWSRLKEHIWTVICDEKEDIYKYLIAWMANCVQKPGHPAATAIALRGGQGTGKGCFVRNFGAIFGIHFVHLDSTRHLTGNFNAHLHNAIVVFADEAAWPGDKAGLGALRRMITEPTLAIERKGLDIMTVPNMLHLLLASNEEWTVPAAIDERRFVVLDVNKTRQNDIKYFTAIEDEAQEGGTAAMLHDLLEHKIDVPLRSIPKTKALYEQKRLTGSVQLRWWYQILRDGDFWFEGVDVPGKFAVGSRGIDREKLYDNYVQALDRSGAAGRNHKGLQTELGMFLRKILPGDYPMEHRMLVAGRWTPRMWVFPSLAACRKFYEESYEITTIEADWPEEPDEDVRQYDLKDDM